MSDGIHTGGCQCGAVRFRATGLGRAALCPCRMCQKATGGIGGLYVPAKQLEWTRGAPKYFASSNIAKRGFCGDCGTPLTYETESSVDLTIVTLDMPNLVPPEVLLPSDARLAWGDTLAGLPSIAADEMAFATAREATIVSYQHPDHDTDRWEKRAPGTTEPRT